MIFFSDSLPLVTTELKIDFRRELIVHCSADLNLLPAKYLFFH